MKDTDQEAFSEIMVMAGECCSKAVSASMVKVYWRLLKDFDLLDIRRAFRSHFRHPDEGRFFPKPADIVRAIEGSPESRALQAWTTVEMSMSNVGHYHSVVFDDPLIHAVIEDMGGWIKLCEINLKELPFTALDFQKRYRVFVTHPPLRHPPYLVGICERDNAKDGYAIAAPVLIGNRQKAEAVLQSGGGRRLEVHTSEKSIGALIQAITEVQQKPEKTET